MPLWTLAVASCYLYIKPSFHFKKSHLHAHHWFQGAGRLEKETVLGRAVFSTPCGVCGTISLSMHVLWRRARGLQRAAQYLSALVGRRAAAIWNGMS